MTEVFYLVLNDWEGLYIDGVLEYESSSLRTGEVIPLLKNVGPFEYDSYYLDEDFSSDFSMESEYSFQNTFGGACPTYFEDLEKWLIAHKKNYLNRDD